MRTFIILILFCLLTALAGSAEKRLSLLANAERNKQIISTQEVLYLPNGKALKLLSFGYQKVLSHIIWFKTVNYFGKHFKSDREYTWLNQMCNLVTNLNEDATYAYDFCALMLAWEAEKPGLALHLLNKAIANNPRVWRYYYLRGIYHSFFFKDAELASADFRYGARLKDAPNFMSELAAKELVGDRSEALRFLEHAISQAKNPQEKAALLEHYKKIKME
ncbi:MAG: hypothetical protein ACOX2O_04910 [Bdellovibrionota bacterium]|jgi:hypothetical protein